MYRTKPSLLSILSSLTSITNIIIWISVFRPFRVYVLQLLIMLLLVVVVSSLPRNRVTLLYTVAMATAVDGQADDKHDLTSNGGDKVRYYVATPFN